MAEFLDLPIELRFMIYEFLPTKVAHHSCLLGDEADHNPRFDLVRHSLCGVRILATCRQINEEATKILGSRLARLKVQPIRFIANLSVLRSFIPVDILLCLGKMHITKYGHEQWKMHKLAQSAVQGDVSALFYQPNFPMSPHRPVEIAITTKDADWDAAKSRRVYNAYRRALKTFCVKVKGHMDARSAVSAPLDVRLRVVVPTTPTAALRYPAWQEFRSSGDSTRQGPSLIGTDRFIQQDEWMSTWVER